MLLKFEDLEKQVMKSMRGGEGSVLLEKVPNVLNHMKMYAKITIKKGSSIGLHTHLGDEEIIYVLKGQGTITVNGKKIVLLPGMVNITKENENHMIENNNDDDLQLLAVVNEI